MVSLPHRKGLKMFKLKELRRESTEKKVVKKEDVETLLSLREEEKDIALKLETVKGFRERKEMEIYSAIKSGFDTGRLPWILSVEKSYRVYPAWKLLFIEALGEKRAAEATEKTRATGYIEIVVEEK